MRLLRTYTLVAYLYACCVLIRLLCTYALVAYLCACCVLMRLLRTYTLVAYLCACCVLMRLLRVVLCVLSSSNALHTDSVGVAWAWRRLGVRGICLYNLGGGVGLAGREFFGNTRDLARPPFGQSFSQPRDLKYIATHTENTKNPKNPW